MVLLNGEVYDAFLAAGVDEPKARRAAESVTETQRIVPMAAALEDVKTQIVTIQRDLALLKWGQGVTLALMIALFVKLWVG